MEITAITADHLGLEEDEPTECSFILRRVVHIQPFYCLSGGLLRKGDKQYCTFPNIPWGVFSQQKGAPTAVLILNKS